RIRHRARAVELGQPAGAAGDPDRRALHGDAVEPALPADVPSGGPDLGWAVLGGGRLRPAARPGVAVDPASARRVARDGPPAAGEPGVTGWTQAAGGRAGVARGRLRAPHDASRSGSSG